MNNRGILTNTFLPTQISQQDTISQSDSGIEQSNSPTVNLKQRAIINNRSLNNSSVIHSNSANGITNSSINSDSIDNTSSLKQSRSVFECIPDLQNDNQDFMLDDQQQYDRNSSTDDRQSMSSPEKKRRQIISTKLFKPFQNMRFRKKNTTT
jgi:hypothetical protein